jgi:cysteine desulfurase
LDNAATTPMSKESLEAMAPWLGGAFNPSSLHEEGRKARAAVDLAREQVAQALGCLFGEIVFTSSGTEAANLAVLGPALACRSGGRKKVIVGSAEHHCVLHCRPILESWGYEVLTAPVDRQSRYQTEDVERLIDDRTFMVSLMHANNETGAVNDVSPFAALARAQGALFHTDAVQTFPGSWRVDDLGADLLSVSAHKFGGPSGVGALYVRSGVQIEPVVRGGGQERGLRAGTEPVAAIVGMAAALAAPRDLVRIQAARDHFAARLAEAGFVLTLGPAPLSRSSALPGHCHGRFPGVPAESMLVRLDRLGVSAGSGAACSSGSIEPSHVALAMGWSMNEAREALRFTFGRDASLEQAERAAGLVLRAREDILAASRS